MYDAFTSPPMPEWNALRNEDRARLMTAWEFSSCPHSCGGDPLHFYDELRCVLKERERHYLEATMAATPDNI